MTIVTPLTIYSATYPGLPQIFIQTPFDLPTGGHYLIAANSAAFQSALNSSQAGDIIQLQAGTTYTGPFTLPAKLSETGWIYIISSAYSSLPGPCTRVSPGDAANMPKLVVTAGNGGTINTASNAHHFRFVGIEFRPVANNFVYNIIYIGNGETAADKLPNNIVFDRCYIHGDPSSGSRRGIGMNGSFISVIDSYISDCKEDGADSQALACWSSTGPLKIVNNYLEGAGENVIFGGSDPSIPNAVPSDIEIRYNYFFKPLRWMNEAWDIKNLLEFKNAQRVLVEGNHFENNWPNAQSGFALLITPRNQNNTAPWSVDEDITIRFNIFDNIAQGINISGFDSPNVSQRTSRLLIQNNVWHVTNLGMGGDGRLFQVLNGPTDVIIDHNTGFCTNAYLVSDGNPKTDFFVFSNNIVTHANYGFIGSGTAYANTTLAMYFNPNWEVVKNVDIGGSATNYPAGNYFPVNIAAVGFVNYAGGDLHLTSTSTYKNLGTDGKDLGADIDSIAIASTFNCEVQTATKDWTAPDIEVSLYPVPADVSLHIHINGIDALTGFIIIFDQLGRPVQGKVVSGSDVDFETSQFLNGIYFVQLQISERIIIKKIVVQHSI
ncbi:MAG: T9SS type A sorting domain-containing protein [Saprospiraceae bacterium]